MKEPKIHRPCVEDAMGFRPVRPSIRTLQVGDYADFPILQMGSARTAAYELGKRLKRKFVTATIDDDTYRVTRTA